MRDTIELSDEQIENAFDNKFNLFVAIETLVFTRDTLADFVSARSSYRESGKIINQDENSLIITGAQVRKGQPRRDMFVYDFGDIRAVEAL